MSPALRYTPVYFGLFASLILAVICNAYLDIHYGSFTTEVILWGIAFAISLKIGWYQKGEPSEAGKLWQRWLLALGVFLFIFIFMPTWGLPRAGLYFLAMLQVANNCVTTTRRHLYLGLLVAMVMVLFASSHHRADWTLLFYLVPFVVAAVFTLVAEQINSRLQLLRLQSRGQTVAGGQGAAIIAATGAILSLSLALYLLTPQVTWPYLQWAYGQTSKLGSFGENTTENGAGSGLQENGKGSNGAADSGGEALGRAIPKREWPTPEEMRAAAARPGMPQWQAESIRSLADLSEGLTQALQPLTESISQTWQDFKKWLSDNRKLAIGILFSLIALALLAALLILLREARAALWLRTRWDYLRHLAAPTPAAPDAEVRALYSALERLFALYDPPRLAQTTPREHLEQLLARHHALRAEWRMITALFEESRYGPIATSSAAVDQMRALYRKAYQHLTQ